MKFEEIRELIQLCNDNKIAELDVEMKGVKVRILSSHQPQQVEYIQPSPMHMLPAPHASGEYATPTPPPMAQKSAPPAAAPAAEPEAKAESAARGKQILSPMVGTFYRAPSPDAPPFVDVGSKVSADSVVCIIEAMKLMNEIKAEASGKIVRVLVENGQPVEFNQPLFEIEPA